MWPIIYKYGAVLLKKLKNLYFIETYTKKNDFLVLLKNININEI